MKRVLSVILAATLIAALAVPSFAASDSELTKLVKSVKSRIDIPTEYTEFESDKYTFQSGMTEYNLSWSTEDDTRSIRATINSRGDITSYGRYDDDYDYDTKAIAPFTAEEYAKHAADFVKKANPSFAKELDFDVEPTIDGVYSNSISVSFERRVNGLPLDSDGVWVTVDKLTADIRWMDANWTYAENIPLPDGIIDESAAGAAFLELSAMRLSYMLTDDGKTAKPIYAPTDAYVMIDAHTGERFERIADDELDGGAGNAPAAEAENAVKSDMSSGLTEKEVSEIDAIDSLISGSRIKEIVFGLSNTGFGQYKIDAINYSKREIRDDVFKYYAYVQLRDSANDMYADVTLDAQTGELQSLYAPERRDTNKRERYDADETRRSAEAFMRKYADDIFDELHDFSDIYSDGWFDYSRRVNELQFAANGISIRISPYTGKVTQFSRSWDESIEFMPTDGVITPEDAGSKLFASAGFKCMYMPEEYTWSTQGITDGKIAIIYMLNQENGCYIDAVTGKLLDYNLSVPGSETEKYEPQSDLKGHFAEASVRKLAENGIIVSDAEQFKPNEVVTQGEVLALIESLNGGYYPLKQTADVLARMVSRGIISPDKANADALVTRELALCYLVRALGFKNSAEIKGIFKTGFKDEGEIDAALIGYVAIGRGLGIVSGNGNGSFNPKNSVTRGELAVMLCNALTKK